MKWTEVVRMWVMSYIGNILGATAFALLIFLTGLFYSSDVNGFYYMWLSIKWRLRQVSFFPCYPL